MSEVSHYWIAVRHAIRSVRAKATDIEFRLHGVERQSENLLLELEKACEREQWRS